MAGEENRTTVLYKAIADFSELAKNARKARREIRGLKDEEADLNEESARGAVASTKAKQAATKATKDQAAAARQSARHAKEAAAAEAAHAKATDATAESSSRAARSTAEHARQTSMLDRVLNAAESTMARTSRTLDRSSSSTRRNRQEITGLGSVMGGVRQRAVLLDKALDKIGNWRPRLMPPFIALIPVLGGLLGLLNPLVAGLGAVGAAAFGMAANLGSIGGAALAIVPALATLLSLVGALKTAFGGVGNAFKQYQNMKKATGGAAGGTSESNKEELTQAEQVARAWERYRRSIEDVRFAQDDLDDARAGYTKRLNDLRKAVDRAALSEARAAANSQLARENYANVLADPGSTKGDKMMAAVDVDQAKVDLQDVRDENKDTAKELADMQRTGVEGDRDVIQAKRRLTDAIWAERDARLDLTNAQRGETKAASAAATATDLYNEALSKLSPSARAVVLALIGMSDAWSAVRQNVQESFFSEIVDDINLLLRLFPALESMLSDTAGAAGRVASALLREITTPEWLEDIRKMGPQNAEIITILGGALISVLNILKDLTIAVGPFAVAMAESLAEGADNMERLVGSARGTGQLADWLETVNDRMSQWWRIIKNIGSALFNYGAAAGDFGQWITDAFEQITLGWKTSSEEAREAGSPFRQFLEDIKPLLTEVGGLVGDFFRWFGEEAADPENIQHFIDLVKIIREDLGPALARILDSLADSGAGERLVEALASIFEALATFLENGGAEGMGAFMDTLAGIADGFSEIVKAMPPKVISALATSMGVIAALRWTGLSKVLGLILSLSTKKGFLGTLMGVLGAGGAAGAHSKGGLPSMFGSSKGGGRHAAGGSPAAGGPGAAMRGFTKGGSSSLVSKVARGGIVGAIGAVAGTLIADKFKDGKGGANDIGASALGGLATGAGVGSLGGGWGALAGAIVGALGGTYSGIKGSSRTDAEKNASYRNMAIGGVLGGVGGAMFGGTIDPKAISGFFSKAAENISKFWNDKVVTPFNTAKENISTWWEEKVVTPFSTAAGNVSAWWEENVTTPFNAVVGAIGRGWDELVVQPFTLMVEGIGIAWDEKVVKPFNVVKTNIETWWNDTVIAGFKTVASNISTWWNDEVITRFKTVAANVSSWWNTYVVAPFRTAAKAVKDWWNTYVVAPFRTAAGNVQTWWNTYVVAPFRQAAKNVQDWWNTYVVVPFRNVSKTISDGWAKILAPFQSFADKVAKFDLSDFITQVANSLFSGKGKGDADGSWRGTAIGGGSALRRVESVMPSGLRVTSTYRTPAENKRIGGHPNSLHMDRNNPAVDIAGPTSTLDRFAEVLQKMGGWRQLLWRVAGHYDHIHVAHKGGQVSSSWPRSPGDKPDERTTRLQVGEVVVPKSEVSLFKTQGLAPQGMNTRPGYASPANPAMVIDNSITVEKLEVINPAPETASDSLPRTIRKLSYLGGKK